MSKLLSLRYIAESWYVVMGNLVKYLFRKLSVNMMSRRKSRSMAVKRPIKPSPN